MSDVRHPPDEVDYDAFMRGDLQERIRTFNAITPENRASLVSTHIRRWRDANRHRLGAERLALVEAWLELVRPDLYRDDRDDDVLLAVKDLERRTATHFSRAEMGEALTIHGPRIPPTRGDE